MKKIFFFFAIATIFCSSYAQKVDRSKKPTAGPAPIISLKDPVTFVMPNGITVLIVENHTLPKINASYQIDAGPIKEGNKAGVISLMGGMLGEGTKGMSKAQFDEAIDQMGADVGLQQNGAYASALTRYFDKAFGIMADGLRNPAFPADALEKLKSQTITSLKSNDKNASAIAGRVGNALSYGKNTAFGEFESISTVSSITLADILDAYKNYITPSRGYLTFVGDITPAAAKAIAIKYLGSWTGKKLALTSFPTIENPTKSEINFINMPTAVQAQLSMSNLVNNPMNGKNYFALLLANHILGGGSSSKLFTNLREKHAFTYGSYSNIGSGRFQSKFTASAAVRTDKADSAVAEMVNEIIAMRDGKITDDQLKTAKAVYNGNFALKMEDPALSASNASNILINNLPKDFYKTYLQKINAVTVEDIKRVSKEYFSESRSRIIIVGNADKIQPNLLRLGYPIKNFDINADPVEYKPKNVNVEKSSATTDKISAFSIVEDYLKAIGGKDALKKINTLNVNISMEMQGRNFEGSQLVALPHSQNMQLKMGEIVVMKTAFNGTTGYQIQGPQKNDMSVKEVVEMKDERVLFPQIYYTSSEYKTEYVGGGEVDNEPTYRLKVTMPSGRVSVQNYSRKSGLLIQEETSQKVGDQEMPIVVTYKDYKSVNGIVYPHSVTRSMAGQEFTFNISNIKANIAVTEEDFK